MSTLISRRRIGFCFVLLTLLARSAHAQVGPNNRIRTPSSWLHTVIAAATARSVAFQSLVEQLQQSDVIVYMTCEQFNTDSIVGRTSLMSASVEARYVLVGINCMQTLVSTIAIVAHELTHVLEIATSTWVVDASTIRRLYRQIGYSGGCGARGQERFETSGAIAGGERIKKEFLRVNLPALDDRHGSPVQRTPQLTPSASR